MSLVEKFNRVLSGATGFEVRRALSKQARLWRSLLAVRDAKYDLSDERDRFMAFCNAKMARSRAQLFQDLFVLFETREKRGGFFVEFGATDGVSLSNTFLLEIDYGWTGILAEPARAWHARLAANRKCMIDTRCIYQTTGATVLFNEAPALELSTIEDFSRHDGHAAARTDGQLYEVATISLNDLLAERRAPADTEGSELMILSALDFDRYRPKVITVEHNNVSAARSALYSLLNSKGYVRKFPELSMFDDWYVAG